MGLGGVFREVNPPERIIATEKFDDSWFPDEAITTTEFVEKGEITETTITVLCESKEARDIASSYGM